MSEGIKNSLFNCEKLHLSKEDLKNDYTIAFISGALVEITIKYIINGKTDDLFIIEELLIALFVARYVNLT
ncbi:hypothetical protein Cphy_0948 [Lachnoclostridium phytofermentans ISDg]|uniref:TetR family transcriptional regulator n=1 Tax=Lachnoclostridium phytofermentans (strain ATCC 700394 / DSM 18823 / ISDg) TaxID=357809 RepID=A9KLY7_LACP7|nr:hypothetical protein Cphy_0948 [Lachnoclostridium phytofermentans ISDg]